jgi:hypothetical protein
MMKPLLIWAGLVVAAPTAFAAGQNGIIISGSGRDAVAIVTARAPQINIFPSRTAIRNPVTIFSNLASYRKGRYWSTEGSPIQGPGGGIGPEQWRAIAFTSAADHVATVVRIAVGWVSGTNGLIISLNADRKGLPGKTLASMHVSNLPDFGSCCALDVLMSATGIPLSSGKQYWIVAKTGRAEENTQAAWDFNDTDQLDSFQEAFYCPSNCGGGAQPGWNAYQSQTVSGSAMAVAVLGTK